MGRLAPGAALRRRPRQRPASAPTARSSWRSPPPPPTASGTRRASSASASCPTRTRRSSPIEPLLKRQLAFGYTQEDLRVLLAPLLRDGREPTGSMGNDLSLAVFSDHRPSLFSLLQAALRPGHQPGHRLGPRAACVMSLRTDIGPQGNLLSEEPQVVNHVELDHPILTDFELERLRRNPYGALHPTTIDIDLRARQGRGRARGRARRASARRRSRRCERGHHACSSSATGRPSADRVPIPSLLACSTVHHAPRPRGHAAARRARRRVGRAARDPPPRGADRLRRDARSTRT